MSERPIARVPTVLQMEAVECGAACLAMILGYHGRHVSLEEVRDECGVSRDGAKAGSVVKAARRYGLEAHGFRREPGGLGDLPLPYVVFWAMNHFVVIEGFRDGKVWLNDPAVGPRRISEDEFDRYFTGVVLTFVPGPDFVRGGHPPRLWDGLRRRLVGSTAGLWLVVLVTLSLVVPGVVIPGILRVFVDDYLVGGFDDWLRPMLFGLFLAATTKTLLDYLQQRYLLRLQVKLALTSSSKFVWHLLGLPMEFFSQRFAGDLSRRIEANDRVAHLLSGEVSTSMVNLVSASFYALVMLSYNLVLGAIAIGLQLLNLLAVRLVWRRREDVNRYLLQLQGKLLAVSMNGVLTIETVKASGAEPELFERWAGYQSKLVSTEQELGVFTQLAQVAPTLLSGLTIAAVLGYGSLAVMDGELTVGGLVAFQSVMLLFATPIRGFVQFGDRLQEAGGDLARLDDVLHYKARPLREASAGEGTAPRKLSGHVDIANLSFGYSKVGEPVIEGFDLHLQPGARVAIVGPTGSGKSTLLKLVAGLFQPWQGQVLLDGRPVAEINRRVLANSLAAVDQEIFLFEGTVRDNLTLWDDTVPQERIEAAARDACIHDVIMARPQGYGGFVAEGGANFSGGERQRLEIARGLAIEPSVLVLDEATSALDPVTELQIDDNLRRRGCTCLIVAHRLSTVRDCEEIIVLDEGRIVERGTHDALMAKQGKYAALVRSQ